MKRLTAKLVFMGSQGKLIKIIKSSFICLPNKPMIIIKQNFFYYNILVFTSTAEILTL